MDAFDDMAQTFLDAGLRVPPIPASLRPMLCRRSEWLWSTRDDIERLEMYSAHYAREVVKGQPPDYLAVSHAGHGANSYSINYQLLIGPLALFTQTMWGGVYLDNAVASERVIAQLTAIEPLVHRAAELAPDWTGQRRLLVIESTFRGAAACQWITPGAGEHVAFQYPPGSPRSVLEIALEELDSIPVGHGRTGQPDGTDPERSVGHSGLQLIEVSEGRLISVERETPGRLYGWEAATDGDPVGLGLIPPQITLRKSHIQRRTPVLLSIDGMRATDGRHLAFAGTHGWTLADMPATADDDTLAGFTVPDLAWPEAQGPWRDLRTLLDCIEGSLLGAALGDMLATPTDGLNAKEIRIRCGEAGLAELQAGSLPSALTDATISAARSIVATRGSFSLPDLAPRLVSSAPPEDLAPATHNVLAAARNPERLAQLALGNTDAAAAARSGPIGLVHAGQTSAGPLLRQAIRFALPTHRTGVGVAGAVALAATTGWLVQLRSTGSKEFEPKDLLVFAVRAIADLEDVPTTARRSPHKAYFLRDRIARVEEWLNRTPAEVFARTWTGPEALESVPAALLCFLRNPSRPRNALLDAANASHSTRLIATMTGSLVGAWLGAQTLESEVPDWMAAVPDRRSIATLAENLMDVGADLAEGEPPPLSPLG